MCIILAHYAQIWWISDEINGKKDGSLDWTWTSDIRINSPPFYRLNYEGIVYLLRRRACYWLVWGLSTWRWGSFGKIGLFAQKLSSHDGLGGIFKGRLAFPARIFAHGRTLFLCVALFENGNSSPEWVTISYMRPLLMEGIIASVIDNKFMHNPAKPHDIGLGATYPRFLWITLWVKVRNIAGSRMAAGFYIKRVKSIAKK